MLQSSTNVRPEYLLLYKSENDDYFNLIPDGIIHKYCRKYYSLEFIASIISGIRM